MIYNVMCDFISAHIGRLNNMSKKLRIGVMGVNRGNFMLKAAEVFKDEMVISAICETDDKTIDGVRDLLSPETVIYKDFDEFIHSGLDGVLLSNYFHEHAVYAIRAFEAGVPVLSETTAAPSLGECVDLAEAYEKYNGKYMLAANCLYFQPLTGMMEGIKKNEYGPVVYAEAEYIHTPAPNAPTDIDYSNLHWRKTLPTCYYNMHTLAPLMYVTKTDPVRVLCKGVMMEREGRMCNVPKTFTLTEMDNGAVFNTTGCVGTGTDSKWYRIACKRGTYESQRYDYHFEPLVSMGHSVQQTGISFPDWEWGEGVTDEQKSKYRQKLAAIGHGGIDFFVVLNFLRYLRGETEPYFDIYRSLKVSAVGILSWYSVLNDSKQYDVPDFRNPEDREKHRGDYRMPFGKTPEELTLPCRIDNQKEVR